METEQTLKDYKPHFLDKWESPIYYERRWFCTENKVIHGSEKEVINCKHCFLADKKQ
jgi:hypothetical protein